MKNRIAVLHLSLLALNATAAELIPVLRPPNSSSTAEGSSFSAAISGDARFVTFLSHANNLVTNDSMNPWMDLFLRDLTNGMTTLVSVDIGGMGGGNDNSGSASVSANGTHVAFESAAPNLVAGDTNGFGDVFLRNMASGVTRWLSAAPDGTAGNGGSGNPLISQDGRYVVYESRASNLVNDDTNGTQDIFIYDGLQQSTRLVSSALIFPESSSLNNGPSHAASITPDARLVAYVKSATNFPANPPRVFNGEIFVWDAQASTTEWISLGVSNDFTGGTGCACYNPTISASGQHVVFKAYNGSPAAALYRRPYPAQVGVPAELIAANAVTQGWAQVSMDGRFMAYEATDGVRVWDGLMASNRLVLANLAGVTGRVCSLPSISADGNRTVFLVASNRTSTMYVHDWSNDTTTLVLVKSNGMPVLVNDSASPLLSEDGRTIVFDSRDASLVSDDANLAYDVFASGVVSGEMTLVSARAASLLSGTSPTPSSRWPGSISANGQVAVISTVDLTQADTNRSQDLYVRELRTGAQTFLGRSTNSTTTPSFSADGRYVAYLSVNMNNFGPWEGQRDASVYRRDLLTGETMLIHSNAVWDLSASTVAISQDGNRVAFVDRNSLPFGNGNPNLYMRDVPTGTISLISTQGLPPFSSQNNAGNGASTEPRFSPDGRWLFFASTASNLATNYYIFGGSINLFGRDLINHTTLTVSSIRNPSTWGSYSVSANSRFVATVDSYAPSINDPQIGRFDLQTRTPIRVAGSLYSKSSSISADGRWIAFDGRPLTAWQIYVRDTALQTNELISMQAGTTNPATRSSSNPQISHDGRYVIFASDATNLVAGDANSAKDIFIRDRLRGVTLLASINRAGTGSGNGASLLPVLAADGRTLLFQSFASDLIAGDFNETADVFVLRLGAADSDGDGMDDDWEVVYFNSKDRDGSGDFDGDGSNDLNEHQLGTDPTNGGSVFQVLKLTREHGQGTKLLWSAAPGRTYRVQFKDDIASGDWSEAPETVTAAGTSAVWTDDATASNAERFYRVLLVP